MSYEFKMQGVGNRKKSRLYKKTRRASMNKIDATHLPMRVQSDKGGYWSQPSRGSVHIPYSKIRKFLMTGVGRPVDKVYSEFLQEGSKYAQIRNLQEIFNEFIHQRDNYANRGLKLGGFYVSNGILNYKASKKRIELFNRSHVEYNRSHFPDSENLINSMNPESVNVLEPHSHKTEALIKEFWGSLEPRIPNFTGYIPVYPDAGAVNRYQTLGEVLICSKTRNPDTGKLEGFHIENPELLQDEDFKDFPLVVMDDLCDAGGTFVGIADKIREVNPDRKLAIYVTHMVNPKGITTLSENYDEVYFTNSYADWDEYMKLPDNVRIIKVI